MAEDLLAPLRERSTRSALLLDVDGTLAPIVPRPDQASVPEATCALLIDLNARYAMVVCVSGRQATAARRVVGVDELAYIGNHGLEYLPPRAQEAQSAYDAPVHESAVRSFAIEAATPEVRQAGIRVEDKESIWSFHWRDAPDEANARTVLEKIALAAERQDLVPHWGRKVLEIRPALPVDKGTAIEKLLMNRADVDAALYAGDDTTDVDAFRSLRRLRSSGALEHSVCVGVRSDEGPAEITAEADLVVDGTGGICELLTRL